MNTHGSLDVCRVLAKRNRLAFRPDPLSTGSERKAFLTNSGHRYKLVFTPTHGSWRNQVELWFSVLGRRFLKRGDFASAAEFEARLRAYLEAYNAREKHPYRWTYTGQPLVRGTPFSQTRRQRRHGRAWLGPRPKRFERLLDPPRPYQRRSNCSGTCEMDI